MENDMRKVFFLFLLLMLGLLPAENIYDIPILSVAPSIDGRVDSDEWEETLKIEEFYQISPGDNMEPSERTEFFMGHDNKNLYFLVKCYVQDKSDIRNFHCSRDKLSTTDRVFIYLDTFNSMQKAYYIGANPNSEQADGIIVEGIDPSIDLFYNSRGRITDYGYLIEFSLPLKSIKYRSGSDVEWGLFVERHIPEKNEEISSFPVKRGGGNFYDNYGKIRFSELPSNLSLKVIPSLIGNYSKHENLLTDEIDEDQKIETELNLFFEPSSVVTATMTINPDFNIIEADALNIEVNNRYPTFCPEKRPFFIEGTNPFNTNINIFHTRQIIEPKWGAKISGSFGNYSFYTLAAIDDNAPGERFLPENTEFADTPFGFLAFSRKFNESDDQIRIAGTFRKFKDYENYLVNLDNNLRINDKLGFNGQLLFSSNEIPEQKNLDYGFGYNAKLDYYNGTWYILNYAKAISKDLVADLGYIPEVDLSQIGNRMEFQIHAQTDQDFIRYLEIASIQNIKYDFDWKDIRSFYWEGMAGSLFKNNFQIWTGLEIMMENYMGKDYYMYYPWLNLQYYPIREIGGRLLFVDGKNLWFGDEKGKYGDYRKMETTLYFRPTRNIDIEFLQKYHETSSFYIARTLETKIKFQIHKNFWFRAIVQVMNNDLYALDIKDESIDIFPMFTFKPNANGALYLGASKNETRNYFEKNLDINTDNINYFLKISYTFDMI